MVEVGHFRLPKRDGVSCTNFVFSEVTLNILGFSSLKLYTEEDTLSPVCGEAGAILAPTGSWKLILTFVRSAALDTYS